MPKQQLDAHVLDRTRAFLHAIRYRCEGCGHQGVLMGALMALHERVDLARMYRLYGRLDGNLQCRQCGGIDISVLQ